MIYFFIFTGIIAFLFMDIGVDLNKEEESKIHIAFGILKVKISNKYIKKLISFKSEGVKKDLEKFNNVLKLKPLLSKLLANTTLKVINITYYEDVSNLSLTQAWLYQNACNILKIGLENIFLSIKNEKYRCYLSTHNGLEINISSRIKIYRLVILFLDYFLHKIGGKIYDKGRRIFKNKL